MTVAVAMLNLVLGTVYTSYGLMTIVDLKRGWRDNGFSHFGFAWLAMAFTCGPHHLDHGIHVLASRDGGGLDVIAIAAGLPVGVTWFLLRVEAMMGGRGDRFIAGTPAWLQLMPIVHVAYLAAMANALLIVLRDADGLPLLMLPNLGLVVLYSAIGVVLLRTQFRNHPHTNGWSVSGLSLALVMFTCAMMHAVYTAYVSTDRYDFDGHALAIHIIGVPAAAYFLWVVWALHRGTLADWNRERGRRASVRPAGAV